MGKKFSLLFTALFLCACCAPGLGMALLGESQPAANETLSPKPVLKNPDGSWNLEVMSDAADYFADHFAFRQELITADSTWKAALFHTSSQEQVALGREGWLFYAETLDDFTGADLLTGREAYSVGRSLKLAQEYVEGQGAQFLFTVAPNKISLYPQRYGDLQRGETTALSQVCAALSGEGVAYCDLLSPLRAQEEQLYHKLDSHWTYKGAALAHDVLLEALGLPAGEAFSREGSYEATHQGDLYVMLYPASQRLDDQWHFAQEFQFSYDAPIRAADDPRIQTSSQGEGGNLLMFRDSFGNTLHSLLAEDFGRALFSRAQPYDLSLMDLVEADFVVVEIVERNLDVLARTPFVMPAPQREDPLPSPGDNLAQGTASQSGEHTLVTGRLAPCDQDSPIYLRVGGAVYEASPVGAWGEGSQGYPFTAYLPQGADLSQAAVLYREGGLWQESPLQLA